MRTLITFLTAALCAVLLSSAALADWNPGDDHKMHFPQLPDPNGWDVAFNEPLVLADDWMCSETGTVDDIHFWFSSHQDQFDPAVLVNVHASIHANIPAVPGVSPSMPGELLWERDFPFPSPEVKVLPYGDPGEQGWYNPNLPPADAIPFDHSMTWQANITNIPDPFIQKEGTIYWLDLSVVTATADVELGWKTSLDHFEDDAVWAGIPDDGTLPDWQELFDPIVQPPLSLDLAFVITGRSIIVPEPAGLGLMAAALLTLRRRRR